MMAPPVGSAARDWTQAELRPPIANHPIREHSACRRYWRTTDLVSVGLLLILASGLRLCLVAHTEVAARDSIGYIRYAWQLENRSWIQVLRETEQPPLYALAIKAASAPVRQFVTGPKSIVMQRTAQLVSALAG